MKQDTRRKISWIAFLLAAWMTVSAIPATALGSFGEGAALVPEQESAALEDEVLGSDEALTGHLYDTITNGELDHYFGSVGSNDSLGRSDDCMYGCDKDVPANENKYCNYCRAIIQSNSSRYTN